MILIPYNVIYQGEHIVDLSQHPEKMCFLYQILHYVVRAAGRYQFFKTFTWYEKSRKKYHPNPTGNAMVESLIVF